GYRTEAAVANYAYLSESLGFGRGFDSYRLAMPWTVFERSRYPSVLRWVRRRLLPSAGEEITYSNAGRMTAEAINVLGQLAGRQRFFMFVNYMDAHWPYAPPAPFRSRFGAPSRIMSSEDYAELERAVLVRKRAITGAEQRDLIAAYDG